MSRQGWIGLFALAIGFAIHCLSGPRVWPTGSRSDPRMAPALRAIVRLGPRLATALTQVAGRLLVSAMSG